MEINFTESLQSLQTTVKTLTSAVEKLNTRNNQTPITPNKSKNNESEFIQLQKSSRIRNIPQTKHANQQLELEIKDAQLKIEKIIHRTCKQQLPDILVGNKSYSSTVLKKTHTK